MPSEFSPADRSDQGRQYPVEQVVEAIGEDPGRFLDRDPFEHGVVWLEGRGNAAYNEGRQRVVRDGDVSAPGGMIRDRIDGIDSIAVAASWMQVERQLDRTPGGGRDLVIDLLRQRIAELEEEGERSLPGLSPEEQREQAVDAYETIAPKPEVLYRGPDGEPTGRSEGTTASQKLSALSDGGEDSG